MTVSTVTLSSKGQLALPKALRQSDALARGDVFKLERQAPGKYLLQKLAPLPRPRPRLVKNRGGFLSFRGPAGSPGITSDLVKQLESETV
jgi:bifunctional DNA-binding transcriptional regulator/antitoxin component of YhaV-PrlF toxin-antitoxin module